MLFVFDTNLKNFKNDFEETFRAFAPDAALGEGGLPFFAGVRERENSADISIDIEGFERYNYNFSVNLEQFNELSARKREIKRAVKVCIYDILSEITKRVLPYGSLTGVRPAKLFYDTEKAGVDAPKYFTDVLRVSPEKTALIAQTVENQRRFKDVAPDEIDVFVNIPICPTRCSYCSFACAEYGKVEKLVPQYRDCLLAEIDAAKRIIKDNALRVRAVYVGGGTPTSLGDADFEAVISACGFNAPEFTIEAGRPDTISGTKIGIMKAAGATRVSVNAQSFNQKTLDLIGRKHSVERIYEAFFECREAGFSINTDLIAMLPGESLADFEYSVDSALALSPENLTVHTLAIKAGSRLKESDYVPEGDAAAMIDYSRETILAAGYIPYYLYRQKYMSGALENTGYCRRGSECVYNVDMMEETTDIIALGAGAISKRLSQGEIARIANPKSLELYIGRIDEIISSKKAAFGGAD